MDYKIVLYQKLGGLVGVDWMMVVVSMNGILEGLVYNFDIMCFGDMMVVYVLVKSICFLVVVQLLSECIYKVVIIDGIDIFDQDVLVLFVKEVGVMDILFEFDFECIVVEIGCDEMDVNQIVNGVLLFLFNNKVFVFGV